MAFDPKTKTVIVANSNDDPPFQPASYKKIPPPALEGAITVIGRVKRSMIDM